MSSIRLFLVAALSMLLLSGCTAPWDQPAPPSNNSTGAPSANATEMPPAPPADVPPLPPEYPPSETPQQEPAPPVQYLPPVSVYGTLSPGQSLDFGEGTVELADVWVYSTAQPAVIRVRDELGEIRKEVQLLAGSEASYTSASGRKYWIYLAETWSSHSLSNLRAKLHVFSAREDGGNFEQGLYENELGKYRVLQYNSSKMFAVPVVSGVLNRTQALSSDDLTVLFLDLSRYPEDAYFAQLAIYTPDYVLMDHAQIPPGHAYVVASSRGRRLAIYNEGTGVGKMTGNLYSSLKIFEPNYNSVQTGRTYFLTGLPPVRPDGHLVQKLEVNDAAVKTERDFYLRLVDYRDGFDGFAVFEVLDDDLFVLSTGYASPTIPFTFKDQYGRAYALWTDSVGDSKAAVSIYRTN